MLGLIVSDVSLSEAQLHRMFQITQGNRDVSCVAP